MLDKLRLTINSVTTFPELLSAFDNFAVLQTPAKLRAAKDRITANQKAREILERVKGDYSKVTEEERDALRAYTGLGGIGGSTNEYYTPKWVASAVWDALAQYGFSGGKVLEPAAGVGVFSETKPKNSVMTAIEMDATSGAINQILHPDDHVINSGFEAMAKDAEFGGFDVVTGNPPYGDRDDATSLDAQYKDVKKNEQYFVLRSIDKAKAGGLIALVLPTQVVDSSKLKKFRTQLAMKAEFLGAHRLPSGVFDGSTVVTDLVIWRKHSEDAAERIQSASPAVLKESMVLWDTWINGKWFDKDGKKFINGSQSIGFQGRKLVDRGNRSNEQIAQSLSHRFESRIDWSLLDTVEPISEKYEEGSHLFHNGKQWVMEDGQWREVSLSEQENTLDKTTYGIGKQTDISKITGSTQSLKSLTVSQATALYEDYPHLCGSKFKNIMRNVSKVPKRHRGALFAGIVTGYKIEQLQNLIQLSKTDEGRNIDQSDIDNLRRSLADDVQKAFIKHGRKSPAQLSSLDSAISAQFLRYQSAINDNGELSDLLSGELDTGNAKQFDLTRIDDVLHHLSHDAGQNAVTLEEVRRYYANEAIKLDDDKLLDHLAGLDGVAVNNDGSISSMRIATSGSVSTKRANLLDALANASSEAIKQNITKQLEVINEKAPSIPMNDIKMKLTDKWVPKSIMLEFLHDQGYTEFQLGRFVVDEDGFEDFVDDEQGDTFTGYRFRGGKKTNKQGEEFERQIESYLNAGAVRGGGDSAQKSLVRERIRNLDKDFTNWCATSIHADELERLYNENFNDWIEPDYDDSSIELKNVSGAVEFLPYQNKTIRKHAQDGHGIIALGTGLGKTLTALGLAAHNHETGRSNRTAFVVPKSVIDNWLFEAELFFGEKFLSDKLFVGLDIELDKNGKMVREPLVDEEGNPRTNAKGEKIYRPKVKVDTNGKRIAEQLHSIAQTNAKMVFMTKDVYNSIPLKPQTIAENVESMVEAGLVAGSNKYVKEADSYREAQKNAKFRAKHADDGTKKKESLPYFEDLHFDSVIVDEGHDFRNSYKMGGYSNRLAFLPNSAQADRALDMQLKNNHIKAHNDGKGVFMLTATPTVNSPVDLFNMLSQVLPPETLANMGIVDPDDFVRLFGRTGETAVTKISGDIETKEALLGFQNLDALRGLFNRYVTALSAEDVRSDVHVPTLDSMTNEVEMSKEQKDTYELLRQRADALSNPDDPANQEIIEQYPDDTVFGLIRMMDKANTDMDLYEGKITYQFPKGKKTELEKVLAKLPKSQKIRQPKLDDEGEPVLNNAGQYQYETIEVPFDYSIEMSGKFAVVRLPQDFDAFFAKECESAKLKFTHPVSPKYAKFLENAKTVYLDGGKQLVFTEEKTQHVKIARMIADYVGCDIKEIGIINSDTVAGKKGSKATEDDEEAGLAAFENAYNSGRYRFMVMNKKAEVGINLHRGTTDIHHLTLPWTPSSLTQRNGRGARVGSKASKVNVHYYAGKGSFDQFRIATIERKAKWISDLFNGDEKFVENGSADDGSETAIMLAANPEQAKARIEQMKAERERKLKLEEQRQAAINISKYVQASIAANTDTDELKQRLIDLAPKIEEQQNRVREYEERAKGETRASWEYKSFVREKDNLFELTKERKRIEQTIKLAENATSIIKKLKSVVNKSVEDGTFPDYGDITTNPELYATKGGNVIRKGYTYLVKMIDYMDNEYHLNVTVSAFDRANGTADGIIVNEPKSSTPNARAGEGVRRIPFERFLELADIDQDKQNILSTLNNGVPISDVKSLVDKETFIALFNSGELLKWGHHRTPIVRLASGKFEELKSMSAPDGAVVVYPDPSDNEQAEALLRQVVKETEEFGNVQSFNTNYLQHLVGSFWKERVQELGKSISQADVTKRLKAIAQEYESREDMKAHYDAMLNDDNSYTFNNQTFISEVRKAMNDIDWSGYVNRQEIRRFVTEYQGAYSNILRERRDAHIKMIKDKAFAAYQAAIGSSEGRKSRLEAIKSVLFKYVARHAIVEHIGKVYPDDNTGVILVYADLAALGITKELSDGDKISGLSSYDLNRGLDEWYYNSKEAEKKVSEWLQAQEPAKAESKETTQKQTDKAEQIAAVDFESFETLEKELPKIGIKVKMITENVSWKHRRYRNSIKAYEKFGLMDTNGKSGALASLLAGNKEVKEKYGAQYGKDISPDFDGSWWFIDSESDLESLYNELLANA